MNIGEFLISIVGIVGCLYLIIILNGKMTDSKIKISLLKKIILVIVIGFLTFLNKVYNISESTFIIHFMLLVVANILAYKMDVIHAFLSTAIIYIIMIIGEAILSIFLVLLPQVTDLKELSKNVLFTNIFSLLDIGFAYLLLINKNVLGLTRKFTTSIISRTYKYNQFAIILIILALGLTAFKITFEYTSLKGYLANLTIVIVFIIVMAFLFFEVLKITKEKEKQESLLSYMAQYEELIDSQRINRHEMLNNLVTLKSFKNKNSKAFTETLNNLINEYDKNDLAGLQSIYNLPSGIKGLLYYKVHDVKSKGNDVVINVGMETITFFDEVDTKIYVEICKILGILIDNAGEAASKAKRKEVIIDIYKEKGNIIIYIENSMEGIIDLSKINEKHFSSKGKDRGLGLFIVKGIINKRECYTLKQEINKLNHFVTTFTINIETAK